MRVTLKIANYACRDYSMSVFNDSRSIYSHHEIHCWCKHCPLGVKTCHTVTLSCFLCAARWPINLLKHCNEFWTFGNGKNDYICVLNINLFTWRSQNIYSLCLYVDFRQFLCIPVCFYLCWLGGDSCPPSQLLSNPHHSTVAAELRSQQHTAARPRVTELLQPPSMTNEMDDSLLESSVSFAWTENSQPPTSYEIIYKRKVQCSRTG